MSRLNFLPGNNSSQKHFSITSVLLIFTALIALTQACSAQENYVVFGKGGGFTGEAIAYKLLQNGKVLKGSGLGEIKYTEYSKIKKSKARKIFAEVNALLAEPFSQPGNMYYFITWHQEGNETSYSWGATGFEPPKEMRIIFQETFKNLSALSYNTLTE